MSQLNIEHPTANIEQPTITGQGATQKGSAGFVNINARVFGVFRGLLHEGWIFNLRFAIDDLRMAVRE
jgi:hypothetical protein